MKKKYFAVYILIIAVALLSLPFAFGNWSQSVHISGYIKTAELEPESKEDETSDENQNVSICIDNAGENECVETTGLDDYEADKSGQDAAQNNKGDGGIDSGERTDTPDEGDKVYIIPGDELNQEPAMPEAALAPVEDNDIEAEPESSSSPEPQQETAEDGVPENPENPSNPDGESEETETDGDENPVGEEAVTGDNMPAESEPDTSSADEEDIKTD